MMNRSLPTRAKLTLWYFAVTSLALCVFGLASFQALRYTLVHLKQMSLIRREERLLLFLQQNSARPVATSVIEQLQNYVVIAHEGNLFQIRDLSGALQFPAASHNSDWLARPQTDCIHPSFSDIKANGVTITVMCHDAWIDGHLVRLYIGSSLEDDIDILSTYCKDLLLLLPCLLSIAAVGGYLLSKRAMEPVDRMTKAALGIGIGNLSARLPEPSARDELWSLATAWNRLLDRLEEAVSRLSRFSADASHDLRTSITVMLGTAQLSLQRERSGEEYRDNLQRIVNECRTASTLLDALLSLARSDNFVHEVALRKISTTNLVVSACHRVEDLAESSGIILDWRLPDDDPCVEGDELLLQRLLGILLDNAIKYTPKSGEILVEVVSLPAEVVITVRDTGVGMSHEIQQRIFDRFYQADLRERKNDAGSGLGLAIAKWIAEAHRASLTVESAPNRGSSFEIRFPAHSPMHSTAGSAQFEYSASL
jgi:two-component system heavy metal sensor histidine kinase CusS